MTSSVRGPLPSSLATAAFRAALALDAKTSNGAEELLSALVLVLGWASPPENWWGFSWLGPPKTIQDPTVKMEDVTLLGEDGFRWEVA